jgi:4-hydroxy-tetrahydrodipicolinate reductase
VPKKSRKNLIRVALSGGSGRMGRAIKTLSRKNGVTIVASLNSSADWENLKASDVDLVVDFSTPQGLVEASKWCLKNKKRLVSGTTGGKPAQAAFLKKLSRKVPVLYSANMSAGIAATMAMIEAFRGLGEWDFKIDETHHKKKKDKPSGTALLLQRKLQSVVGRPLPKIKAFRRGDAPGIHQIWAKGPYETILLNHTAFNRKVFAQGALKACRWLFDKKAPGLYDLSDLYKMT